LQNLGPNLLKFQHHIYEEKSISRCQSQVGYFKRNVALQRAPSNAQNSIYAFFLYQVHQFGMTNEFYISCLINTKKAMVGSIFRFVA